MNESLICSVCSGSITDSAYASFGGNFVPFVAAKLCHLQCIPTVKTAPTEKHELCIMTNDGWVVTLITEGEIKLDPALVRINSIIVQPKEDYDAGKGAHDPNAERHIYRLPDGRRYRDELPTVI